MKTIGILVASVIEAKPFIERFELHKIDENSYSYEYKGIKNDYLFYLIISGLGRVNSALATHVLLKMKCDIIFNLGLCVGYGYPTGAIVSPMLFFNNLDGDESHVDTCDLSDEDCQYKLMVKLCTTLALEHDPILDGKHIIDSEAYPIVALCKLDNVKCYVLKIIVCSDDKDSCIKTNDAVENLADFFIANIKNYI